MDSKKLPVIPEEPQIISNDIDTDSDEEKKDFSELNKEDLLNLILEMEKVNFSIDDMKRKKIIPDVSEKRRIRKMMDKCVDFISEELSYIWDNKIDDMFLDNIHCEDIDNHRYLKWVELIYKEPIGTDFFQCSFTQEGIMHSVSVEVLRQLLKNKEKDG